MDFEKYMTTREPNDPDPTAHMRTLIEFTKANRRAAVENCAEQNPPIAAKDCPGGVPFCALIVDRRTDQVIAKACNHGAANPVFHGEIAAINLFATVLQAQGKSFPAGAPHHDLYTTGESCAMCMGAIMWAGFRTVFFGSDVEFLNNFYSQIMIKDGELTGLWRACQGKENTVRTRVVGGVLENENNALFEEFGFQFCPIGSTHWCGPKSSE
jgi:tRNA(Arg) A34 adenosine deaminase TadA